jgi:hypothetical protein
MARPPRRNGTVAAIVAYLDLIPGKEVNPGVVINWVNKFRECVVAVCETSRINLILIRSYRSRHFPNLIVLSSRLKSGR